MPPMDFMTTWITQLKKGIAEYTILLILAQREAYGYEILQALLKTRHLAFGESTIYPLLSRLAEENHVSIRIVNSQNGPPRRYYCLTPAGKKRLAEMERHLNEILRSIKTVKEGKYRE